VDANLKPLGDIGAGDILLDLEPTLRQM